jgi:gliding motility-associated-like protein
MVIDFSKLLRSALFVFCFFQIHIDVFANRSTHQYLIVDSLELSVSNIEGVTCTSNGLGSITLRPIGGTPPYLFSVDGQNFTPDSTFYLPAGSTNAWVRDANLNEAKLVNIVVHKESPLIIAIDGPMAIVDPGELFQLQLTVNRPSDSIYVNWQPDNLIFCPDCLRVTTSLLRTDTIHAVVSDFFGCVDSLSFPVEVKVYYDVFVPNAFSPNDDGLNDVFEIYPNQGADHILQFKIFNRWGAVVHDSPDLPWDGTFNGKKMEAGIYAWYAEVQFIDGVVVFLEGEVLLVR